MAGAFFVVAMAGLASVRAVAPRAGETVIVSSAAGGVGSVAVQLARRASAHVIGLATEALMAIAELTERGELEIPIHRVCPPERVRDAYAELAKRRALRVPCASLSRERLFPFLPGCA